MKKLSVFLALVAVALLLSTPVAANSAGSAVLAAPSFVTVGQEITVTVSLSGVEPILAAMVVPEYNKSVFELVDVKFADSGVISDFNGEDGVILWERPTDPNGRLASFTLRAKTTAAVGEYALGCRISVRDGDDVLGTLQASSVTIKVNGFVYGDANGDGKISMVDLSMLRKYFANLDPATGESSIVVNLGADVNGDTKISTIDLSMLRKYFANLDPSTGESSVVLGPKK